MKKYLIILALVGITTTSCYEKLNITPPHNIIDEQIQAMLESGDEAQIKLVLGGMADAIPELFHQKDVKGAGSDGRYNSNQGQDYMRNLEGNDVVFGNLVSSGAFGYEQYALDLTFRAEQSGFNEPIWYFGWDRIHPANKLLFYIPTDKATTNLLKEYRARALFLRAYGYTYLMENYRQSDLLGNTKGLPLYDTWNPTQDYKEYSTSAQTWAFILGDLKEAVQLMKAAGIGITKNNLQDIDLGVVNYQLARAASRVGEWSTVITACNEILAEYNTFMSETQYVAQSINGYVQVNIGSEENPVYVPMPKAEPVAGYEDDQVSFYADNSGFQCLAQNPECLFGFNVDKSIKVTDNWLNVLGTGDGGIASSRFARIDNRLLEAMHEDDYRADNFILSNINNVTDPFNGNKVNVLAYSNLKFANTVGVGGTTAAKPRETSGNIEEVCIRMSEVLLMKAEAEAQSGTGDAKATLNLLLAARTRSGKTPLTCDTYTSMSGMTPLQMVQLQWRIEMWAEKGMEFYNNKRWNIPVDRANSTVHYVKGSFSVPDMTNMIPLNEIQYNPYAQAAQN